MSRNEALVVSEERKLNQRVFQKPLQKMRENFSTKTKKQSSFECLKLLKLLQIFLVINLSLNTPIYRRGLGINDKTLLMVIRKY